MGHTLSRKLNSFQRNATSQRNSASATPSKSLKPEKAGVVSPQTTPKPRSRIEEPNSIQNLDSITSSGNSDNSIADKRTRDILRQTWSDDFGDLYELGTDIYSEIFRVDPSAKKLFRALDDFDLEKDPLALRECKAFSKQALRFVQTISMTVKNSSHLEKIDNYLKDIGQRHVQYKDRGFEPGHWQVFEQAIANVMGKRALAYKDLDETDRQLLANVYETLAHHIVVTMTVGFYEGQDKERLK